MLPPRCTWSQSSRLAMMTSQSCCQGISCKKRVTNRCRKVRKTLFLSLPLDFCVKKGKLFWKSQVDCTDTEGGRGKWKEKEREITNRKRKPGGVIHLWTCFFTNKWGQRQRQRQTTKRRQGDASGKRNEVDGGERRTEKSQVFSSVAQRWCSLRAAARVQLSVPLRHSEPL